MGTCLSTAKSLYEAWERQIVEMAGLGTAFPCVPTHLTPDKSVSILNFIATKHDGDVDGSWSDKTCKAPVKSLTTTSRHTDINA